MYVIPIIPHHSVYVWLGGLRCGPLPFPKNVANKKTRSILEIKIDTPFKMASVPSTLDKMVH